MVKRIWKKPQSLAGKKALRKSISRQILSHMKADENKATIVSNYWENKTPEQRGVLKELFNDKAKLKQATRSRDKELALQADRLTEQSHQRRDVFLKILRSLSENPPMENSARAKDLKRISFLLKDLLQIIEKKRLAQWEYSRRLSKEQREKYFEEFPLAPRREWEILQDFLKEIGKTTARVEKAGYLDSADFETIIDRLLAKMTHLEEQHPK